MIRTAILVDGGFYRKRAAHLWGKKTPKDRANELVYYCNAHLKWRNEEEQTLYRIFYYDCPPISKTVYHPLLKKNVNFKKSETYIWANDFYMELKQKVWI